MEIIFSLTQINGIASDFVYNLRGRKVVALHGGMGAGKTTLIHAVCVALGVNENISSPTFSIIHEYMAANKMIIYHMDLFRLKDLQEAINAGIEDCIYSGDLCFIEWPEKIGSILPASVLHVYIEMVQADSRRLIYKVEPEKSF